MECDLASSIRVRGFFGSLSGPGREVLIFAVALCLGLLVVPPLIWAVGAAVLGPYAHGGALALMSDVFSGLVSGAPSMWVVALGPYVLIQLARLFYRVIFGTGASAGTDADDAPPARRESAAVARRPAVRRRDPSAERREPAEPAWSEDPAVDPAPARARVSRPSRETTAAPAEPRAPSAHRPAAPAPTAPAAPAAPRREGPTPRREPSIDGRASEAAPPAPKEKTPPAAPGIKSGRPVKKTPTIGEL